MKIKLCGFMNASFHQDYVLFVNKGVRVKDFRKETIEAFKTDNAWRIQQALQKDAQVVIEEGVISLFEDQPGTLVIGDKRNFPSNHRYIVHEIDGEGYCCVEDE